MRKNAWLLIFVLLGGIYYLSSVPGLKVLPVLKQFNAILQSFDVSMKTLAIKIAAHLPGQLDPARTFTNDFYQYAKENPVIIEFMLRKAAHVIVFFFITLAFFFLLRQYFAGWKLPLVGSFIAGTLMAILDEYHQTFTANRSGNIVDVFIDMIGVSMAVGLITFSLLITNRWKI